jgi:hypothetical protein
MSEPREITDAERWQYINRHWSTIDVFNNVDSSIRRIDLRILENQNGKSSFLQLTVDDMIRKETP